MPYRGAAPTLTLKLIRDALAESGIAPRIDALVAKLLDESSADGDSADTDGSDE